jgi:molybdopterin synthase sulfur carrier subunit
MAITVRYFASLREQLGKSEDALDDVNIGTVADVWSSVTNGASVPDNLLCAVNMEYVNMDTAIKDGDEVAFFPPVTGG